jgi:UDPglucose 6-dehydrogenase
MKVSIIGSGYVGLVSGACLAELGHEVTCVDQDEARVAAINAATAPIHEPGLPELLQRHAGQRLRASTDLVASVAASEISFIAVGTPARDGRIDLTQVVAAAHGIGLALRQRSGPHTVVVKSTVVPGTTEGRVREVLEAASGRRAGDDFGLGMNPEFLTEGSAVRDFLQPDRLVLGGMDTASRAALLRLYAPVAAGVMRLQTTPRTAEMIKYASNALLATMISFANEVADLCTAIGGIDAMEVMAGVHASQYLTVPVGGAAVRAPIISFLSPGCGFGGSCLPKDLTALVGQAERLGLRTPLLRSVLEVNQTRPAALMKLIARHRGSLVDVPVTVLGLSFKPDTDDLRESPAFPILELLRRAGARLTAFDPVARPANHPALAGVQLADSLEAAVAAAEVVVVVTAWEDFRALPGVLHEQQRQPLLVDGRRLLSPDECRHYAGIGRN